MFGKLGARMAIQIGGLRMWHEHDYKLFGVIPLDISYTIVETGDGSREIDDLIIQYNGEDIDLPEDVINDITGGIFI